MTSRDDMVFIPRLVDRERAAAPVRAREERRVTSLRRRRGALTRMARRRAAARMARRRTAASSRKRVNMARSGRVARGAGRAAAGRAAGRGASRLIANPVGAIIAAIVVAGVVAIRLTSGQSLENLGAQLNKTLLGDLDEQARAKMDTVKRLGSDEHVARLVGVLGLESTGIRTLATELSRLRKEELDGAALILEDDFFQANNTLDLLILRARDAFTGAWRSQGGDAAIDNLRRRYKGHQSSGKEGHR